MKIINKIKLLFALFFLVFVLIGCDTSFNNNTNEEAKHIVTINYNNDIKNDIVEVFDGMTIQPNTTPIKEGYDFIGWYCNGREFNINTSIVSDIEIYAKWKPKLLSVRFYNKGSLYSSQGVYYNNLLVLKPKINDDKFLGWYILNGNEQTNEPFDFDKPIKENTNLYAKYDTIEEIEKFNELMNSELEVISYGSYTLPTSYEDIEINWSCNKEDLIKDNKFVRPYEETIATLIASCKASNGKTQELTYEVTFPGYKLAYATTVASTYLSRNYSQMTDDLFDTMDIIFCAFANINSDGTVTNKSRLADIEKYILPKAKEKGVYVVLSLAPGSKWTETMNPSNNLIDKVVQSSVDLVNKYGLDGIDIDWEHPKTGEETWFTLFASKLNQELKKIDSHKIVSAAITGGKWQIKYYDIQNSINYLDYVNMMTYGMEKSSRHYHNALYKSSNTLSSASIDESITIFNNYNVPSSKILIGLAFYGVKQTLENGTWGNGKSILYNSILSTIIPDDNYIDYYDEVAGVPYFMSKDGLTFISYENERSIKEKCAYVIKNKIGGVMAWEAGCDTSMTLVKAVKIGLNK